METVKLVAQVDAEGTLHVAVPHHFANRQVEVVLVLQTVNDTARDANGWPIGFFERTYGALADDPLERPEQLPLEVRDEIE
jgi:hypothetical protein